MIDVIIAQGQGFVSRQTESEDRAQEQDAKISVDLL